MRPLLFAHSLGTAVGPLSPTAAANVCLASPTAAPVVLGSLLVSVLSLPVSGFGTAPPVAVLQQTYRYLVRFMHTQPPLWLPPWRAGAKLERA